MTTQTVQQVNCYARTQAQSAVEGLAVHATGRVEYRSRGRVAVIGGPEALEFVPRLQGEHQTTVVLLHGAEEPSTSVIPLGGRRLHIEGYLGHFKLTFGTPDRPNYEILEVDLVLDLGKSPVLEMPLPPPGYLYAGMDETSLANAQQQLDELTGTFEKPRYFAYDAAICAHARSGNTGCTRCIDACPAEAITALAESIEVNPYLCQGGGVCASVCPTGAIRYNYPGAGDMLNRVRSLLQVYRQHGGQQPVVAFIAEVDVEGLQSIPDNLLLIIVEELASVGMDIWLSTLAYGARQVLLIDSEHIPARVREPLQQQLDTAGEILTGLGYKDTALQLIFPADINTSCQAVLPDMPAATYAGLNEKRRTIFMALDHLFAQSPAPQDFLSLSDGAAFGSITVDSHACTLCFSCTSVCPSHAVFAGNDEPAILFNESQCVQCGICATACPEQAIALQPRLLANPELRQRRVTLHSEEPLCCISCGKPFATRSIVNQMLAKLENHWMFQNERAKRRLQMCDDCRVVDIVQDPDAMQQGFTAPRRQ